MTNVSTLTTPPTPAAEVSLAGRVLLTGVSWETFKALMADLGEDRACRIAYDGGLLEIRMPLTEHEEPKILIASFIETLADELEIEIRQLGALTSQTRRLISCYRARYLLLH
jgi:Uma2 family endonuclease